MIDSTDRSSPKSAPAVVVARTLMRLVVMALFVLAFVSQSHVVLAGWVPAYLTAEGLEDGVLLEWATISEYNLSGFEILCKLESEPEEAYHPITSLPATGSLEAGASYRYFVDSGLFPGESYCFRIQEIALVEEPPEYVDICGYGLGIEPAETPVLQQPQTGSVEVVTTAVITPPPVQSLDSTPTPITILPSSGSSDSLATLPASPPTSLPTVPPTLPPATAPSQPPIDSPLPTPSIAANNSAQTDANQSPMATPAPQNEFGTPDPQSQRLAPPNGNAAIAQAQTGSGAIPGSTGNQPTSVPGPAYIVVTAVPTPEATFTPLPTVTPLPETGLLAGASNPTVDNIVLLTLCFTFMGAGSLGALGLTATTLYVRSRQRRD